MAYLCNTCDCQFDAGGPSRTRCTDCYNAMQQARFARARANKTYSYTNEYRTQRALILKSDPVCAYHHRVGVRVRAVSVDHIVPIKHGGTDDLSNLAAVCAWCNSSKQDKPLDEYLSYLAKRVGK